MKVCCIVLAMIAITLNGDLRAQETLRWKEWNSVEGQFSIDVPIPAPVRPGEQRLPDGGVYLSWTIPLSQEDGLIFGYLDLSKEDLGDNDAQRIFQSFRRGSRKTQVHTLLNDVEMSLGTIPARDYMIALKDGADGYVRERNYLAGTRLYRLIILGSSKAAMTSDNAEHFLGSFKIADVEASPVVEKLEGHLQVVSCQRDGKEVKVPLGKKTFTFSPGLAMIFTNMEDSKPRMGNTLVDSGASPKQFDLISLKGARDWVQRAIFELHPGEIKLCIADVGGERPTEFMTAPGSGRTLFILRRKDRLEANMEPPGPQDQRPAAGENPPTLASDLNSLSGGRTRTWKLNGGDAQSRDLRLMLQKSGFAGRDHLAGLNVVTPKFASITFSVKHEEKNGERFLQAIGKEFEANGADPHIVYVLDGNTLTIKSGVAVVPGLGKVELKGTWESPRE